MQLASSCGCVLCLHTVARPGVQHRHLAGIGTDCYFYMHHCVGVSAGLKTSSAPGVYSHWASNAAPEAPWLMCIHVMCRYGTDGWEVVFGYDQEKMMGERAGAALVLDLMDVDKKQSTPAMSMT